jgi:hypothetical protein
LNAAIEYIGDDCVGVASPVDAVVDFAIFKATSSTTKPPPSAVLSSAT